MASARSQKLFDRISNAVGISEAGKAWLLAVIDPFHDQPIMGLVGLPDGQNSDSLVQEIKRTVTVVAPDPTKGWDAHVQMFPFDQSTVVADAYGYVLNSGSVDPVIANKRVPMVIQDSTDSRNIWPCTITVSSDIASLGIEGLSAFNHNVANGQRSGLQPGISYTKDTYRVISKGFEVSSTGPDITKSGTVYVYLQPGISSDGLETQEIVSLDSTSTWRTSNLSVINYPRLPGTVTQISAIPNSLSWEAKKGCYIPSRLDNYANVPISGQYAIASYLDWTVNGRRPALDNSTGLLQAYVGDIIPQVNYESLGFPGFSKPILAQISPTTPGVNFSPYHHSGAYFAGLNPADKLQVTCKWYIERFPASSDENLSVLAKPSPISDIQALEMANLIMSEMPSGMVFDANSFGDWFMDAANVLLDNVAPALAALPGTAGAIGKGITVAGGLAKALSGGNSKPRVHEPAQFIPTPRVEPVVVVEELQTNSQRKKKNKTKALSKTLSASEIRAVKHRTKKDLMMDLKKL